MDHQKGAYRAVIYARYSTDLQNPHSIDDQIRLCKKLALERFGIASFVKIGWDAETSGEVLPLERRGIRKLFDFIEQYEVDLVITESIDRLSRRNSEIARLYDLFNFYGAKIHTAHEGEIGLLQVGFAGVMSQLSNENLRSRIRRAQTARAAEGRSPAGLAYGYRVVKNKLDDRGEPIRGLREIDPQKAQIVRRIYREYSEGKAVKSIVRSLNNDEIPSPSGKVWRSTSLKDSAGRQNGVLFNEIYRGMLIFNKVSSTRNPQTGRIHYRINPESEWIRTAVPHLRIIDENLWQSVQARIALGSQKQWRPKISARTRKSTLQPLDSTRAKTLTGLVKCGSCGGLKSVANDSRYICSVNRYSKKCRNARGTREKQVLNAIVCALKDHIRLVPSWEDRLKDKFEKKKKEVREAHKRIKVLRQRIDQFTRALEYGIKTETVIQKMYACEQELLKLEALVKQDFNLPDNDLIRKQLLRAVGRIESEFFKEKMTAPIRAILELVIEVVFLSPVPGQPRGETIEVKIKPGGWPGFYQLAKKIFPPKGK